MKIELTKGARKLYERLKDINALGIEYSSFYDSFLTEHFDEIKRENIDSIKKQLDCIAEEAYYRAIVEVMDVDPEDTELKRLEQVCDISSVSMLDSKEYESNPYLNCLQGLKKRIGNVSIGSNYYLPYEGFLYDQASAEDYDGYALKMRLGFFDKRVDYPLVEKKGVVWMSVTPYEINTMRRVIEESRGKVLALGLGLGYFQYMCSLREEVTSIETVEIDQNVIDIYNSTIKERTGFDMKITKADAISFLLKEGKNYDTIFMDLHHTSDDALLYYPIFLRFKAKYPEINTSFWIEDEVVILLRRIMMQLLFEQIESNTDDTYYLDESLEITDVYIRSFYNQLKDTVIRTEDDIYNLLSKRKLMELASNVSIGGEKNG